MVRGGDLRQITLAICVNVEYEIEQTYFTVSSCVWFNLWISVDDADALFCTGIEIAVAYFVAYPSTTNDDEFCIKTSLHRDIWPWTGKFS